MAKEVSAHADAVVVGSAMVGTLLDRGADEAVALISAIAAGLFLNLFIQLLYSLEAGK